MNVICDLRHLILCFQVANGVIITRQELGSDINPKKLVIAQKNLVARANKV